MCGRRRCSGSDSNVMVKFVANWITTISNQYATGAPCAVFLLIVRMNSRGSGKLGRCWVAVKWGVVASNAGANQLSGKVLHSNHLWNQEQIDDRSDEENPAGQQPNEARDPTSEIKPVQAQYAEPTDKPEQIGNRVAFHSNRLGSRALRFHGKAISLSTCCPRMTTFCNRTPRPSIRLDVAKARVVLNLDVHETFWLESI